MEYTLRIMTYTPTMEDVNRVIRTKVFQDLIFPGRLATGKNIRLDLASADEFDIGLIGNSFRNEFDSDNVGIYLRSDDGIKCSLATNPNEQILHTNLMLKFQEVHLISNLLNYDVLKEFMIDVGQAYRGFAGLLFDPLFYKEERRDKYGRFELHQEKSVKVEIGWMSYFGHEIVEFVGRERFERVQSAYEVSSLAHGAIFIGLQKETFDSSNPDHLAREKAVVDELGLLDFV